VEKRKSIDPHAGKCSKKNSPERPSLGTREINENATSILEYRGYNASSTQGRGEWQKKSKVFKQGPQKGNVKDPILPSGPLKRLGGFDY